MSLMLEATVEYTKQRHQFGVPIGSFQALQHRMAEMFIEVELARSMAYLAAMTLDEQRDDPAARKRGIRPQRCRSRARAASWRKTRSSFTVGSG